MTGIFGWATLDNLQPEPVTLEIWRKLPEEFCRNVEIVEGHVIRSESPSRQHQTAARRMANLIESAIETHMKSHRDGCLDVSTDFDVVLWEVPRTTIRRPDIALFECAPEDLRPLPASFVKVAVDVVSPGNEKMDTGDKKAEYALAGIPWYWLVWVADNQVASIEIHVLDVPQGQYRRYQVLEVGEDEVTVEVPVRMRIDWDRLSRLVR